MLDFLNSNPALTSFIILIFSSLLIFVGWKVLYGNAKKIASRNETFNLISSCLLKVERLVNESLKYWTTENHNCQILKTKEFELEIVSLKCSLKQISLRGVNLDISYEIRRLRRAITLDAHQKSTVSSTCIHLKVEDIYLNSDKLRSKLIHAFQEKHPNC